MSPFRVRGRTVKEVHMGKRPEDEKQPEVDEPSEEDLEEEVDPNEKDEEDKD
jgi:hypothetical protein